MSTIPVAEAHRRCALLLAPLHRRDQSVLLAELPSGDAEVVKELLQELSASSLPIDALPSNWLDNDSPSRASVTGLLQRIDWNELAGRVSTPWLARALTCVHGPEREFCLAALEASHRDAVSPLVAKLAKLPPALERSLRLRLLNNAGQD